MKTKRKRMILSLLLLGVVSIFFFALANGAAVVDFSNLWQAIFKFDDSVQSQLIIRTIRLLRVLGAFLVGSCFALSGALMQGVTRNPLADSGLLGINAGASLAMALCFAFWPQASAFSVFFTVITWFVGSYVICFWFLTFFKNGDESTSIDFSRCCDQYFFYSY